ncbi:MAG: TetR/AcrR family transcriptional regulator [Clostridiales bacterium]|nr:TetR/AcrR family transcriptional regulator [Clostridiales bacterium]
MTIKDAKTNFIVDEAIRLFFERSVSDVTMHDIAAAAGVGEATVYRYFSTKHNLVCAAATRLEKRIFETYFDFGGAKSGMEKLELFYGTYLKIFCTHREFYKFINEFDAFMLSEGKTDNNEYASGLDMFKTLCFDAYEQGVADGSIKKIDDFKTFYYATTHALLALCKKLSTADIVRQDLESDKEKEIAALTEIILFRLKR